MRAFGVAARQPVPVANKKAPADAAKPTHKVLTLALIRRIHVIDGEHAGDHATGGVNHQGDVLVAGGTKSHHLSHNLVGFGVFNRAAEIEHPIVVQLLERIGPHELV